MPVKTYSDYGIDAPLGGSGEYRTACPQCEPGRKHKGEKPLAVNLTEGVWHCHHCDWRGALPKADYRQPPEVTQKPAGTVNAQPLTPDDYRWLEARGISPTTAGIFQLRSCLWQFPKLEGRQPAIAIPFYRDGVIVNWKLRAITDKAFSQSKGGEQCLFNYDAVVGSKEVIITEGEMDCLALCEAGFRNVCSCPNGAPAIGTKDLQTKLAFIDQAEAVFKGAEKIIIAMDSDAPGIPWAKAIANKLGLERCWQVEWSSECKDANDVLMSHGATTLAECINNATPYPVQGLATFSDYRQEIHDYHANGGLVRGKSTGWKTVDELLRLKPGTLNILTGIPSSGKSEWLDAMMLNTIRKHDWTWAIFSPENHPPAYHFGKLAEKWLGQPMFDRWNQPPITATELDKAITELSKSIHILTFDEYAATVDSILARLRVERA
jgi:twinkle protein